MLASADGKASHPDNPMAPIKMARAPLTGVDEPKARWFTPPPAGGWTGPLILEWELRGEAWTDRHAHDEFAYVLEGRLLVSCDGVTVEAEAGDLVRVPAGSVGRYWAPDYARILGIYAPNPEGAPMAEARYEILGE